MTAAAVCGLCGKPDCWEECRSEAPDRAREPSNAAIMRLAAERFELFHHGNDAYVMIGGAAELVRSSRAKLAIRHLAWTEKRSTLTEHAAEQIVAHLETLALFERDECSVYVRVAEHGGVLWADLGAKFVEIAPDGWRAHDAAPVRFRRPEQQRPLPTPKRGGSILELRKFVNAADDDVFSLMLAWLVAAWRPGKPCPIAVLTGEQGTAKSTATRVLRELVDPSAVPLRALPKDETDLVIAARHSHVIAFDNLSGISPQLADAFCRLVTGGGIGKRTLYTDAEESVIEAKRPIVCNGIDGLSDRPDLAERSLKLTLTRIEDADRRDEDAFWLAFTEAQPRILGALFDALALGLRRLPEVKLSKLPRMADFARWISAAEPALDLPDGALLAAYQRNLDSAARDSFEEDPIVQALDAVIITRGGKWEGAPSELLRLLLAQLQGNLEIAVAPNYKLPTSPNALGMRMKRLAPALRRIGFEVDLDGYSGRASDKRRCWRIAFVDDGADAGPTS